MTRIVNAAMLQALRRAAEATPRIDGAEGQWYYPPQEHFFDRGHLDHLVRLGLLVKERVRPAGRAEEDGGLLAYQLTSQGWELLETGSVLKAEREPVSVMRLCGEEHPGRAGFDCRLPRDHDGIHLAEDDGVMLLSWTSCRRLCWRCDHPAWRHDKGMHCLDCQRVCSKLTVAQQVAEVAKGVGTVAVVCRNESRATKLQKELPYKRGSRQRKVVMAPGRPLFGYQFGAVVIVGDVPRSPREEWWQHLQEKMVPGAKVVEVGDE